MRSPLHSLSNRRRTPRTRRIEHVGSVEGHKGRARTASVVKTFAQTLRTSAPGKRLRAREERLRGALAWTARELR